MRKKENKYKTGIDYHKCFVIIVTLLYLRRNTSFVFVSLSFPFSISFSRACSSRALHHNHNTKEEWMGAVFAKLWNKFFNYAEFKVVIVGLDNAGKTTTLYKLYVFFLFFCECVCVFICLF